MLQILYSSGGLFATKMGLKTPFEIRIVTKFSTFYGMYRHFPHKFTHFLSWRTFSHFLTFFQKKAQHNFIKTRGEGGGQRPFIRLIKKQTFFQGGVPKQCMHCFCVFVHHSFNFSTEWPFKPILNDVRLHILYTVGKRKMSNVKC